MFKSCLYNAFRSLWKNKAFTVLNILGLSIGICAALVIYLIVSWDFSFEQAVPDRERIYRVVSNFKSNDGDSHSSGVTMPLVNAIPGHLTGLQEAAPIHIPYVSKLTVQAEKGERKIFRNQSGFIYTSPSYFKILPYQWLVGSPDIALSQPNQIVLTNTTADRYFPGIPYPLLAGKQMLLDDSILVTVNGIVKAREDRTDFTFTNFMSYSTLAKPGMQPYSWNEWRTTGDDTQLLLKLPEGTSPATVAKHITALFRKNVPGDLQSPDRHFYTLQPLTEIHFDGRFNNFNHRMAHLPTLYGMLAIAGFLILLGCINFINLTTAQSSTRSKEIGIRKTLGGTKKQLIIQFMGEAFILTLLAGIFSCLLLPITLQLFSDYIPAGLSFQVTGDAGIWYFLLAIVVVVSCLSGIYPAFVLARYKPVQVLKNYIPNGNTQSRTVILRKSLTISQFVVAQVFIVATLLVSKQVSFSLNKDIGVRKDRVVFFNMPYSFPDTGYKRRKLLVTKIRAIPGIERVSVAGDAASSQGEAISYAGYHDGVKDISIRCNGKIADTDYMHVYQLQLIAGKNIHNSDTISELLVNQSFIEKMGIKNPQEAVGKYIKLGHYNLPIMGVVRDFNFQSLHKPIVPLFITNYGQINYHVHMLLQPQHTSGIAWSSILDKAAAEFKLLYPDLDFESEFFDESLAGAYHEEQKTAKLLRWTAGLAVLISCFGLLGLVTFTTVQRTKEIGVRKVLGASITQIITLLSKEIITLVVIALIIAVPISLIGSHRWLQQFAFRTGISWWLFLLTGGLMILITLITLSIQTIRAALADPAKSLRSE